MTVKFKDDYSARAAMEKAQRELDNATAQAKEALVGYRRAASKALNDQMVPASGRAYKVSELRKQASQKLLDIESNAQASVRAAAEAAAYLSRDQRTIGEQNRDDNKMRLAWERAKLMLDAGVPGAEVVARAAEQGDAATIEAMSFFAPTYLEADIRKRGGNTGDHQQQFDALDGALEQARPKHPSETLLGDISADAENVSPISMRARQEVQGGDPVVALHVDNGGGFSETVHIARENAQLLSRMGGGEAARRAS